MSSTDRWLDDLAFGEESARKTALLQLTKLEEIRALPLIERIARGDEAMELRFVAEKALSYLRQKGKEAMTAGDLIADDEPIRILGIRALALRGDRTRIDQVIGRLGHESVSGVVVILTQVIGILGGKAELPHLETLLAGDDSEVREAALESMERIGDSSSYPTYVRYARDKQESIRKRCVRLLGKLGKAKLVKLLVAMTRGSQHWMVDSSLGLLVPMKDPAALVRLGELVRKGPVTLRARAHDGVRRIAATGHEGARALLEDLPTPDESSAISRTESSEETPIPEGLLDKDPQIRMEAILEIELRAAPDDLKILVDHLGRETENRIRATLVRVIGNVGDRGSLPVVSALLGDIHDRVRANAVEAFSQLTEADGRRPLVPLLRDLNNRVRTNAILALWGQGIREVQSSLVSLSGSTLVKDRLSAIYAIYQIGNAAGSLLGNLVEDEDEEVRLRATECQRLLESGDTADTGGPIRLGGARVMPVRPSEQRPFLEADTRSAASQESADIDAGAEIDGLPFDDEAVGHSTRPALGQPAAFDPDVSTQELSTTSYHMSTELRRKVARDHVERLYRQIGEAYLESSRGSYPEDPKLAERIGQLSQKDDAESQAKRLEKLAELGRRIEKSSDEQVQGRLRILIGRLESAQAELAEIEAKVGERPPGRPEKPRKVKKILIGFAAVAVLTLVVIVALVAAGVVAIPGTGP